MFPGSCGCGGGDGGGVWTWRRSCVDSSICRLPPCSAFWRPGSSLRPSSVSLTHSRWNLGKGRDWRNEIRLLDSARWQLCQQKKQWNFDRSDSFRRKSTTSSVNVWSAFGLNALWIEFFCSKDFRLRLLVEMIIKARSDLLMLKTKTTTTGFKRPTTDFKK